MICHMNALATYEKTWPKALCAVAVGCAEDADNEDYFIIMETPANTVQAMIPFNGTDEIISLVNECSNLSIGLMNLSSFQQWSSSGLLSSAQFLPGSKTGFQTTELVNFTISGLNPQTNM
ncbi:TPA: hypothetical protein ACH3X1_012771 [Trebouxia sp. C0004]